MILAFGSYSHALHEAAITILRTNIFSGVGLRKGFKETWTIHGFLQAADVPGVTAAINALKAGYSTDGGNLTLYQDDGVTPTAHQLLSSQSITGTRIVSGPSFPESGGVDAEYTSFRRYEIVVEAEFAGANQILAWQETLTFTGGGPRFLFLQPLNGLPLKQNVADATPFKATQSGSAIGYLSYPVPPAPLWPAAQHQDQGSIRRKSPVRNGPPGQPRYEEFEVAWDYVFEDASPLSGNPTRQPGG